MSASAVCQIRKKYWEEKTPAAADPEPEVPEQILVEEPVPPAEMEPEKEEVEEDDARILFRALELMTERHKGMDAVMTAQIVTGMWNWKTAEDLEAVRDFLDYLIQRAGK